MIRIDIFLKGLFLFFTFIFLVGCGEQELYSQLPEQEANEMIVKLMESGISAKKVAVKENLFSVTVAPENFSLSVAVLDDHGLPRKQHKTVNDLFPPGGFGISPAEERIKVMYVKSEAMARTLESIEGVVLARVHLAIPASDPLSDEEKPASASIFIKHRRGIDLSSFEGKIKGLVVDGIEGLPYSNVTVALFPTAKRVTVKENKDDIQVASITSILTPTSIMLIVFAIISFAIFSLFMLRPKKPTTGLPAPVANKRNNNAQPMVRKTQRRIQ